MSHRFVRCPHCKMPHVATDRVCPKTGLLIETVASQSGAQRRMSELPPPERAPEPLGFDPAKHRIPRAEPPPAPPPPGPLASSSGTRSVQIDLIGRTVSDRYVVKGILGEGGMGTVYEAEHVDLGRPVAIKVLNPSQAKKRVAVKRFQQEARAAGAIGHPNICEVYDLGKLDDGSPYLVMEKLVGTTLADRIGREGGLPFDEIVAIMIEVLSGLIAAHDKGIIHRDIKPENIFLARRAGCPPIVKILDFGVSKMMPQFQGGEEQFDLTRTGMVMGTPYYMAPEQARGERNLDGRVDVYACGVMMYESIVGKRPFLAQNYNALLLAIINTTPRPLREARPATPPALEAIVVKAMTKVRDDRYASANAMLRELQALTAPAGQPQRSPAPPPAQERMRALFAGREDLRDRKLGSEGDETVAHGARRRQKGEEPAGPGAKLRSGMAAARREDSESIDIPIDITGADLVPVQGAGASPPAARGPTAYVDEPTAVYRADLHPLPGPRPGADRDEWDTDTVVKKPAALMGARSRDRGGPDARPDSAPQAPAAEPFNPDETVNLTGDFEVEIDFSDETEHIGVPPRHRPR